MLSPWGGVELKLGVASITIIIFAVWRALGTLIFGLLDSAGSLTQLFFVFVWLAVFWVAFAIYDPPGERSAPVVKARATPAKALAGVFDNSRADASRYRCSTRLAM